MHLDFRWSMTGMISLLSVAVAYELFAPQAAYSVPSIKVAALPVLPRQPAPFIAPMPAEFAAISDRPLFDSQRKKYVPPPVDAAKSAPPPPPSLSLVGVIIDADRRMAMVKASEGTLASSVAVGAEIGGWQVAVIDPDRIILKAGSTEHEVRLDANKAPPQAVQSQSGSGLHSVPAQPLTVTTKNTP